MTMRSQTIFVLTVALVSSVVSIANAQGYGANDDDLPAQNQQPNRFPQNQQISSLPQYDSPENTQVPQSSAPSKQQSGPQQNLWWMGQNAFQRPPGHPGVELLNPKNPGNGQQQPQPTNNYRNPNSYSPPAQGVNAYGTGQQRPNNNPSPNQEPQQQQFNNPPPQEQQPQFNNPQSQQQQANNLLPQKQQAQQEFNNPPPAPQQQSEQFQNPPSPQQPEQFNNPQPSPQQQPQFNNNNPSQPPQQPQQQYNNAIPQNNGQNGFGWHAPQEQAQKPTFGQPIEAPGCELVNKADCHNIPNPQFQRPPQNNFQQLGSGSYNVPKPQQNYEPPPLEPQPFPQQQQYQPQYPQQQQPIPEPDLSYRPPPQPQQRPQPNNPYNNNNAAYNRPSPDNQPAQSFQKPTNFQNNPRPQPPRQQQPYTPPQVPRPQQQFQNAGQGIRRPTPNQQQAVPEAEQVPYPGCPAAMLCVQDDYCNTIGLIEENPIRLSPADKLHRVALMECSEPMTGVVGVCCRDPNYKDPWPDMNGNGMMKKDGGHGHHPDKGQHHQGHGQQLANSLQKPSISSQPSQGNYLASPGGNPYSGTKDPKNQFLSSSSRSSFTSSESKQNVHVLEVCTAEELCISMSQCNSLNPEFMSKTGLNTKNKISSNSTDPIKVKRCKYERSGIQYLCCRKPESVATSTPKPSLTFATSTPFRFTTFGFTKATARPISVATAKPLPLTTLSSNYATPTTTSSLITGVGLRFHANLHSARQKEINSRKPNPYGNGEEPILLISPTTTPPPSIIFAPTTTHSFRFTTTPPPPSTVRFPNTIVPTATQISSQPAISAFARVLGTTRLTMNSTTPAPLRTFSHFQTTPFPTSPLQSTTIPTTQFFHSTTTPSITNPVQTEPIPTQTSTPPTEVKKNETVPRQKVDITRIPFPVPLRKDVQEDPPIGFIFKGEDLYIPEVDIPSQNYIVPTLDFEARTFPTEAPAEVQTGEVEATTTVFRILDEPFDNSADG